MMRTIGKSAVGQHAATGVAVLGIVGILVFCALTSSAGASLSSGAHASAGGTSTSMAPFSIEVANTHGHGGGGGSSCTTTLPSANGVSFTPSEIQSAYGYSSASTGSGVTIAIIDAYGSPSITSDLACFDQTFGLPGATLKVVAPFGKIHGSNTGWAMETSLDVEWAHAMAPGATLLLIETPSASTSYLIDQAVPYAVQQGARVISMSWGAAESRLGCTAELAESSYFASAVADGVIPVGASGDSGANDGTSAPTVDYPAADPNVVGAGGTTLTTASSTYAWSSESVWSNSAGATGGGVSGCFSVPSYQSNAGISVTTASGSAAPTGRAVPDVAYDSDPYTGFWVYDTAGSSGWVQVGGTSAAAPQWAAIFADALSTSGITNLDGSTVHGLLYAMLGSSSVHDITSGNNGYEYASSGYDACTGVGSPSESSVLSAL